MSRTLQTRWLSLWNRLGMRGDASAIHADLAARYGEAHRAYHTLEHIAHCLAEFDRVRDHSGSPDAAELALWFHDAIYDTRSSDNEARSADLAAQVLRNAGLPDHLTETVATLIMATAHTDQPPAGPEAQLVVDCDLAILGQPAALFDNYERQIRAEYDWVPEPAFRAGRDAVLSSFLERPAIYATPVFRDLYENQARANLDRARARARAPG